MGIFFGSLELNRMFFVLSGYFFKLVNGVVCRGRKNVKEGFIRILSVVIDLSLFNWFVDFLVIKVFRFEKKRNVSLGLFGNGFVENIELKIIKLDGNKEFEFKYFG